MDANVLTIIISILVPMFCGFAWIINRMDKLQAQIHEIHQDLRNIDSRMSRLEGGFTERGYWESRDKKIGDK